MAGPLGRAGLAGLDRLYPLWSAGGYFVIDDYNDYGGCRRAVDEFLSNHDDARRVSDDGNLVLQRRPPEAR